MKADIKKLREMARRIRVLSLKMTTLAKSGHPGGSLSAADIIAALYFYKMRYYPENPKHPNRDRFILSKGHACPAQYAALAMLGVIPKEELWRLRKINSMLQGHPDRNKTPGIEITTGSLGQGFSVANGMALAAKLYGKKHRIYVLLGDGELQEGIVWETAMFAAHYDLNNLVAIVDNNGCQNDSFIKDIMEIHPIEEKFHSFGWDTITINGHDMREIVHALDMTDDAAIPTAIIAKTVKGKGVSFIENDPQWHGKPLSEEQLKKALEELGDFEL
jgi:transketolase